MAHQSTNLCFFFSSRRRHTRWPRDWSSDVCSSDLAATTGGPKPPERSTTKKVGTTSAISSTIAPLRSVSRALTIITIASARQAAHTPPLSSARPEVPNPISVCRSGSRTSIALSPQTAASTPNLLMISSPMRTRKSISSARASWSGCGGRGVRGPGSGKARRPGRQARGTTARPPGSASARPAVGLHQLRVFGPVSVQQIPVPVPHPDPADPGAEAAHLGISGDGGPQLELAGQRLSSVGQGELTMPDPARAPAGDLPLGDLDRLPVGRGELPGQRDPGAAAVGRRLQGEEVVGGLEVGEQLQLQGRGTVSAEVDGHAQRRHGLVLVTRMPAVTHLGGDQPEGLGDAAGDLAAGDRKSVV